MTEAWLPANMFTAEIQACIQKVIDPKVFTLSICSAFAVLCKPLQAPPH